MSTAKSPMVSCPNCQKKTPWHDNVYRPFCSARCKDSDFIDWANEKHRTSMEDSPLSSQLTDTEHDDR